jgi:hypothetical protein
VLARFPDVNDGPKSQPQAEEAKGWDLLGSNGRWIGQAMSVKLLAGMTLFLLVGAVLPFCLGHKPPAGDPSTAGDTLSASSPAQAQAPVDGASSQTERISSTVAPRPAVLVSATSDQVSAPAKLPPAPVARREPSAAPTVAESLLSPRPTTAGNRAPPAAPPVVGMSNWSSPPDAGAQPGRPGTEASASNANNPGPAARSPEYEADARGHRPGEPAAARFEGTIDGTKR